MIRHTSKLSKQIKFNNVFTQWRCLSKQTIFRAKAALNEIPNEKKTYKDPEWDTALPYDKIPGPSKLDMFKFFPGGRYYNADLTGLQRLLRQEYGDILKLPGLFGRTDFLFIFDPNDFSKVFRTEGLWPARRGMDSFVYFRKHVRNDIFKDMGGLLSEQDEAWGKLRSIVNPVMMQPKTVKLYAPGVDAISKEFVEKIYRIRDSNNEVPADFNISVSAWAFESIAFIALDTRLGVLNDHNTNEDGNQLIKDLKDFFEGTYKLEIMPSLWLYYKTSTFKKQMKTLDSMTSIILRFINKAIKNLESKPINENSNHEQSVLEKLLKIDPHIAMVMANDMLMAGVDTTGSTSISLLYLLAKNPEKQAKLREEVMTILKEKDSDFCTEDSRNLPYMRACIKETLRIHPITVGNMRGAGQDLVLKGYQIPMGTNIASAEHLLHLNDDIFPEANKFIPERWIKSETQTTGCPSAKTAHPFAYLPFGYGPRSCIGKRFAELEMEIFISRIIRNFHVEWHYPDMKYKSTVVLVPTGNMKFRFTETDK